MMDISSRLVKRCRKFIEPYRVTDGRGFKLSRYDPGDLGKLGKDSKKEAVDKLEKGIELLEQLQEVLYASESLRCWRCCRRWTARERMAL